tara:strand:- start:5488 stop:6135 length:648 start_codon:yes stop_codon:yes gene_type:complete
MLEVKDLDIDISNKIILKNINFSVANSHVLQIVGKNGIGKTSFLKSLVNLLNPVSGAIFWNNKNILTEKSDYYSNICYLAHKNYLNESLTVQENLEYFYKLFNKDNINNKANFALLLQEVLNKLEVFHKRNTPAWKLSQGQMRKVALARIFLSNKKIWILDEPFVSLDIKSQEIIWDMIKTHLNKKGLIIFTSHQNNYINNIKINKLNLDNFTTV